MKRAFLLILLAGVSYTILAQQNNYGSWYMFFGQPRVSEKFSIHTEVQYRNHTITSVDIEQLLLRAGLNYHFSTTSFASVGYGRVLTHHFESEQQEPELKEHRAWQQLITTKVFGRVKFENRFRIEQRWVNNDYNNRLRYRLMLFIPINKPSIEKGAVFVGIYNELFVNTASEFFDRNRLYGALGYQLSMSSNFQLGMLQQQVGNIGKWHLQVALGFNPEFKKDKS